MQWYAQKDKPVQTAIYSISVYVVELFSQLNFKDLNDLVLYISVKSLLKHEEPFVIHVISLIQIPNTQQPTKNPDLTSVKGAAEEFTSPLCVRLHNNCN